MLRIEHNKDLQRYNSLALPVKAASFVQITSQADVQDLQQSLASKKECKIFVLGGGSNIVFQGDVEGLVIHIANKGINKIKEDDSHVYLDVQAGENWDDFVAYTLSQGLYGLENLSLIPGTVGAAPIQNIGAYGQEVANCLAAVNTYHLETGQTQSLSADDCQFAYRDSIFKQRQDAAWLITSVVFKLSKSFSPLLNYAPLASQFNNSTPSAQAVREAVINIRQSKLPNPADVANAGSFFKNPVLSLDAFQALEQKLDNIPAYPQDNGAIKVSAGFLIEKAGLKGASSDNGTVGMYAKQALVLVNHGGAAAKDVQDWAAHVCQAVNDQFNIELEQEPVIV